VLLKKASSMIRSHSHALKFVSIYWSIQIDIHWYSTCLIKPLIILLKAAGTVVQI